MWRTWKLSLLALVLLGGCRQDMHDQPKHEPLEASPFFPDDRGSPDPVDGTVARGHLDADRHLHQGRRDIPAANDADDLVDTFPFEVTRAVLDRGRERYDIYCSPCHSKTGAGDGMIVRRGFRHPPELWDEKVRKAPVGHLFDVVTRGFGSMPAYARQVPVNDRWAIIAYVRALQLAHHAELDVLPPAEKARAIEGLKAGATETASDHPHQGEHARGEE